MMPWIPGCRGKGWPPRSVVIISRARQGTGCWACYGLEALDRRRYAPTAERGTSGSANESPRSMDTSFLGTMIIHAFFTGLPAPVSARPAAGDMSVPPRSWSAVDGGHVRLVVAFAGGRRQVAEPFELVVAELDGVGGGVLLDAGDPPGAGDRGDVVALGEQPGQRDLRRCGAGFGGDGLNLVDDGQVALEVLAGEAGVGLAPVVVGDVVGGADLAGEEAVAERGVGDEADAQPAQQR